MNKTKLIELLKDPEVEAALGNIMLKAISQALNRKIKIESGKDNPGGPPVVKEEDWNILDFIAKMIPYQEGALRGMQADANKTFNAAIAVVNIIGKYMVHMNPVVQAGIQFLTPRKAIDASRTDKENTDVSGSKS